MGTVETPEIYIDPYVSEESGVKYVESDVTIQWYAAGDVAGYHVTISDGAGAIVDTDTTDNSYTMSIGDMAEGATYTVTVTAIPVNGTISDGKSATASFARAVPQIGTVETPEIYIDGAVSEEGGVKYFESDVSIQWYAAGDVAGYHVTISDGAGAIVDTDTTDNSYTMSIGDMAEGATYTVTVTAIPVNGTISDGKSATASFARIVPQVTQQSTQEQPAEEQPAEQQPSEQQSSEQQPAAQPWDAPLTTASSPEVIQQVQTVLSNWGWLAQDSGATPGALDAPTLSAIYDFQTYVNEQYAQEGAQLAVVDPNATDPQVGTDTLKMLLNGSVEIHRP